MTEIRLFVGAESIHRDDASGKMLARVGQYFLTDATKTGRRNGVPYPGEFVAAFGTPSADGDEWKWSETHQSLALLLAAKGTDRLIALRELNLVRAMRHAGTLGPLSSVKRVLERLPQPPFVPTGDNGPINWAPRVNVTLVLEDELRKQVLDTIELGPSQSPPSSLPPTAESPRDGARVITTEAAYQLWGEEVVTARREAGPRSAIVVDVLATRGLVAPYFAEFLFKEVPEMGPYLLRVLVDQGAEPRVDLCKLKRPRVIIRQYPPGVRPMLHGNLISREFPPSNNVEAHDVQLLPRVAMGGPRNADARGSYEPEYDVWRPNAPGGNRWIGSFRSWFSEWWSHPDAVTIFDSRKEPPYTR